MHANSSTTVILCRHGESEGNREGRFGGHSATPLTERGRAQASATGALLARSGIDVIYTSDLVRAVETAALIAEATAVTPEPTFALRERSVGDLTGLTFEEARVRYADAYAALLRHELHACPPGGESYAQCRKRAAAFLEQALERHPGAKLLFVSHNLTLLQLIRHIMGIASDAPLSLPQLRVDHCALHRFERCVASSGWKVIALNEQAHLDAL